LSAGGEVDLAHPAGTELLENLVRPEPSADHRHREIAKVNLRSRAPASGIDLLALVVADPAEPHHLVTILFE